ncbi:MULTISPECIES: non-heme iron oxygenase ferredoxin subunit [unclassified Acinetobacter]|uniref:Ferredoxin CarAc n=2 Tax=Acinetobacter stercoris TaxID=2126983 RepID=A0A2U3MZP3_9GAMM|nr:MULTISPECIES: non-heme iron oxygenase ferredoxin subunit [unclassified Acinetobacter]MDM1757362.1 non-heme iron oxygenase ferredoxin subunit [Acinetobacter sp. 256-1]MDM1760354.1 non-heme iron oxygenase ferredoxin subunit [Acinetobacter sp. 251-1]SPL70900.1 Ferredoxin CarAc [Acinetobacter stercoris]
MNIKMSNVAEKFLCLTSDVAQGEGLQVIIEGYPPLAVFHLDDGEFYVTDDTCTHGDASLADGEIDGCEVECPFHAGAFDIKTGEPCGAPCTIALKTYPSIVREDQVYLVE